MLAISAIPKYAMRYMPLLALALLLIPLRVYIEGWNQQRPAPPTNQASSPFAPGSALYSVTMLPSGEAWAVGGSFASKPGAPRDKTSLFPLPSSGEILHYTNNGWEAAKVAEFLQSPLLSVSLDSPQDGWAVGWAGTFVHFNGDVWSTVPGPLNFNQNLLGVAMLSPSDGWAVGYSGSILHYDGKQWKQEQSPARVDLHSIAMPSPQDGWAVGDSGTILHYHNSNWSLFSPSPTNNTLNNVSMLSTDEGWAVGTHGTILHYSDGSWESVHPASYYRDPSIYKSVDFSAVAMNSIRTGWIIGDQHFLTYSAEAWIEPGENSAIFSGMKGKLSGTSSVLVNLYSIAMSPSGEGWAVGGMNDNVTNIVIILHYQSGRWSVFS
jgi:photosystem II stability/assembly factor-like uncharacterized protein